MKIIGQQFGKENTSWLDLSPPDITNIHTEFIEQELIRN